MGRRKWFVSCSAIPATSRLMTHLPTLVLDPPFLGQASTKLPPHLLHQRNPRRPSTNQVVRSKSMNLHPNHPLPLLPLRVFSESSPYADLTSVSVCIFSFSFDCVLNFSSCVGLPRTLIRSFLPSILRWVASLQWKTSP
jgi:hypothetical protein